MPLIKEDGTVVTGANAYIDTTFFETYFDERGNPDAVAGLDNEDAVIGGILYATRWIDNNYKFRGQIQDFGQPLDWPRHGATDDEGRSVGQPPGGGAIVNETVPNEVQEACAEVAWDHVNANPVNKVISQGDGLDALKVGPISLDFRKSAVGRVTRDYVDDILRRWTQFSAKSAIRMSRY